MVIQGYAEMIIFQMARSRLIVCKVDKYEVAESLNFKLKPGRAAQADTLQDFNLGASALSKCRVARFMVFSRNLAMAVAMRGI